MHQRRSWFLPVARFFGDDPADPAAWVGNITVMSRDHVEVGMGNRLPGGLAAIDSDGVAVGSPPGIDMAPDLLD